MGLDPAPSSRELEEARPGVLLDLTTHIHRLNTAQNVTCGVYTCGRTTPSSEVATRAGRAPQVLGVPQYQVDLIMLLAYTYMLHALLPRQLTFTQAVPTVLWCSDKCQGDSPPPPTTYFYTGSPYRAVVF